MIASEEVTRLLPHVTVITVCPEVDIGLGVPRDPIRISRVSQEDRLHQPTTGRDVTELMKTFAVKTLDGLPPVDGFILKHRSPTCGPRDVKLYKGSDSNHVAGKTSGLFAREVHTRYQRFPVEDEGRLTNFVLREHFFTRIFLLAEFREVEKRCRIAFLTDFHAKHKLLFMAYHQTMMRAMGRIAAAVSKKPTAKILSEYREAFIHALMNPPRRTAVVNVLQHALGYFKRQLQQREKSYFLNTLDAYRFGRAPLSVPQALLRSFVEREDENYLRQQSFFEPYPSELVEISDSGQGREYR
jgi:uncharacterized protein YbgA (DUF1722 family)/uncharacterized protein YbbK (DUF523 family)